MSQGDVKMENIKISKMAWNEFGDIILRMAKEIQADYELDVIVGIGKSGTIPASIIAKKLGILEFYSIVVSLYGEGKPPKMLHQTPCVKFDNIRSLEGKKVLVVDDFVHTGATLKKVIRKITHAGAKEVRTAVVGFRLDASYSPEYVGTTFEGCLRFPWDLSE